MKRKCRRWRTIVVFSLMITPVFFLQVAPLHPADAPPAGVLLAEKHQKAGVNCQGCHKESPPAKLVPTAACFACHGDPAKLAQKTQKITPNPHASPHETPAEMKCETCHHVHKKSETSCVQCHEEFVFKLR